MTSLPRLVLLAGLVSTLMGCGEPELVDPGVSCLEQPFRAELHVDAADLRQVWATYYAMGVDVAVRPRPPGRFTFDSDRPTMLLDGDGRLLSFSGEISRTGCFDALNRAVYFGPDDLPDPNRPPG